MAVVPTKGPKACNMLKNTEIWKSHVSNEADTCRQWQRGWGFLVDDYQKLSDQLQEANDRFAMQCGDNMLTQSPAPLPPPSSLHRRDAHSRRHTQPASDSSQPGLTLPPIVSRHQTSSQHRPDASRHHRRSHSVPLQASAAIGWISTVPSSLEVYRGPYKPKGDLVKEFSWPREGLPNP